MLVGMSDADLGTHDLRTAIEKSGYYPDVVWDAVQASVAGERVLSFLVHHEPTIDERDKVRRHVTVLVLTPSRLILAHTDEHAPDDLLPAPYTSSSTEAVTLSAIRSVVVNRMVANPEAYEGRAVPVPGANEAVLTIGWGAGGGGRGRAGGGRGRARPPRPRRRGAPGGGAPPRANPGMISSDDFSLRV